MSVQDSVNLARPARALTAIAVAGALLIGCPKPEEPKKTATEPSKAAPAKETEKPAPAVAAGASSDPECVGAWTTEGTETAIDLSGKSYKVKGAMLKEASTDADDQAVLGVIANIKEDTPENLKNLKQAIDFFTSKKVDAIVVDGDLGDNEQQISNVLMPLAATNVPVLVVIGNQEKKADFNNGVKAVAAKHPGVINMNSVRLALLDDVAIVSLPGYFNKSYIHVESGCQYAPADVEGTKPIIKAAGDKAVVLVSHGPPLQKGPEAIDYTSENANVGDPEMTKLLRETGVKFGIFANIREAGGHATNLDATAVVGEGKMAPELYLNPGPADAVGWKMNDRTESAGMVAVMTVKGKQAQFEMLKMTAQP